MTRFGYSLAFTALVILTQSACRMSAPMAVWKAPMNRSINVNTIALVPIHGPPELATKLDEALIANQPKIGKQITLLHPKLLEQVSSIQLAGFEGQPSDIAGLSAARRASADILVQGQIVRFRTEPQAPKANRFKKNDNPAEQLTISWTVIDVASGERIGMNTMTLDRLQAEQAYPELVAFPGEPIDRVVQGIARESWSMFSPKTEREDAILVLPWFLPGASKIRAGNGYARQGRWDLAESHWQDVAAKHSWNDAAWHNLALSAAAREDFELARDRLRHAKTFLPNDRADKTEVWIDEKQRAYHDSLGLPVREGGWLTPDPPPTNPAESVPPTEPQSVDDLPWWTAIPGTKPPGWTWKQWLGQPWVM